jgi:hypothetical protein
VKQQTFLSFKRELVMRYETVKSDSVCEIWWHEKIYAATYFCTTLLLSLNFTILIALYGHLK